MDLRGQQLGRYQLLERIGRGGMSEVYRARPEDGSPFVAIKVLRLDPHDPDNPIFEKRFEREAGIIMDLNHPHILSILDYAKEGDFVYYAMPLISGGTLADVIRAGLSNPEAVCHWLSQIASALDHAHKLDVIHRDLKPGNILLDQDGNAYLTDFGIALLTSFTSNLTQTGIVIGTPAYMSPEQWRDDPLDGRADVYGLAVVVYLLLTGHTPFEADAAHSMMYLHLNEAPPSPRKYMPFLSEAVSQVLLKALGKAPEDRYESAGEFAADFVRAVEGQTTLAEQGYAAPTPPHNQPEPAIQAVIEMPPPVYGNPPSPNTYPIPEALRKELTHTTQRYAQRRSFTLGAIIVFLLALLPVGLLLRGLLSAYNTETTSNPRALDIPRIQVDSPQSGAEFRLGDLIYIEIIAHDPNGGITHVELRVDLENETEFSDSQIIDDTFEDNTAVALDFSFLPTKIGTYRLELIAYRGEVASDPKIIQVQVR